MIKILLTFYKGDIMTKKEKQTQVNYVNNQIGCLTNGGAYGYKVQIRSGAYGDATTWIDINKSQLDKIKAILKTL